MNPEKKEAPLSKKLKKLGRKPKATRRTSKMPKSSKPDYHLGFRLGKVLVIATMICGLGKVAQAQSSCPLSQKANACVSSLNELQREQERLGRGLESVNVSKSFNTLISDVKGKNLVYSNFLAGTVTMKITASAEDVKLEVNGRRIRDGEICFNVCGNKQSNVTWYHREHGSIKKISNGLDIGGYSFKATR